MTRCKWLPVGAMTLTVAMMFLSGCGGGDASKSTVKKPTKPKSSATKTPAAEKPEVAEGFGNLKGQFIYGGAAVTPAKLELKNDKAYCSMMPPVDETFLVNPENKGLKNVVITLYLKRGDDPPKIHESYADSADSQIVLDNHWCRFDHHVTPVRTGQTLVIKNSDQVGHNTKGDPQANASFNEIIAVGGQTEVQFSESERMPVPVGCNIHPWMKGWLVIKDHPYVAVTDENGNFEIKNLPSGNWTFQIWQEKAGYISEVELDGESTAWKLGRREFTVQPDTDNDFGVVTVATTNIKE